MAFKYKFAYTTNPDKIQSSLDAGIIDEGDFIIVNTDNKNGILYFITNEGKILTITSEVNQEQIDESVNAAIDNNITEKISTAVDDALRWEDQ